MEVIIENKLARFYGSRCVYCVLLWWIKMYVYLIS